MGRNNIKKEIDEYVLKAYFDGNFTNLTVSGIARSIGISRSTFYSYYSSVSDVISSLKNKFISFHDFEAFKTEKYDENQIIKMLEKVKENRYFFLCYIKYVLFEPNDKKLSFGIFVKENEYENAIAASIVLVWLLNGCAEEEKEIALKIIKTRGDNDEI